MPELIYPTVFGNIRYQLPYWHHLTMSNCNTQSCTTPPWIDFSKTEPNDDDYPVLVWSRSRDQYDVFSFESPFRDLRPWTHWRRIEPPRSGTDQATQDAIALNNWAVNTIYQDPSAAWRAALDYERKHVMAILSACDQVEDSATGFARSHNILVNMLRMLRQRCGCTA